MVMDELNKIIFFIEDKYQLEQALEMQKNMGRNAGRCRIYGTDEGYVKSIMGEPPTFSEWDEEGILFVTDSKRIMDELHHRNKYVVVLLHENNRNEDFFKVPYGMEDIKEQTYAAFEKAYLRLKGCPWTIMETERCIIREMTVEDVDSFYKIYEEPSITRYMDNLYEDVEEEKAYTKEYIEKIYGFYGYGLWSVIDKESGEIMGRAGLSWREGLDYPELGFVIAVPYQRKGYAYEVCSSIISYGREELGFEKIQVLIHKDNSASINLCRKLGFIYEDRVEDKGKSYERFLI